jgi:hypothetical protein
MFVNRTLVYFANILQAAFTTIFFCQKNLQIQTEILKSVFLFDLLPRLSVIKKGVG